MHYIYPKGITGEQLGIMMEYVDGISPLFIDDNDDNLSFEKQKDRIKPDDVVHVALGKCKEYEENLAKITNKLKDNNISYVLDTPEYVLKYINKLKEECRANGITKFIGLMLDGFAGNKHYGRLGSVLSHRLKDTNAAVVYVCADRVGYEQYLQEQNKHLRLFYIYGNCWDWFEFDIMCITSDYIKMGVKVCAKHIVNIQHGFRNYSNLDEVSKRVAYLGDYLCVVGPKYYPPLESLKDITLIPSGYLGFDKPYENILGCRLVFKKDSVLFTPHHKSEVEMMLKYIKIALTKYRVIFRYRIQQFDEEVDLWIKEFLKHDNFYIDKECGISSETYIRSFCMVCATTSAKNSFPMLSLSPVIVLPHSSAYYYGVKVDESVGINCEDFIEPNKILEIIDGIYNHLEFWHTKILKYRNENIYNFGKASEFLADYLVKQIIGKK